MSRVIRLEAVGMRFLRSVKRIHKTIYKTVLYSVKECSVFNKYRNVTKNMKYIYIYVYAADKLHVFP